MNLLAQQKLRIGTSAWTFDDWRGAFYPEDFPQSRWLEFYSHHFPAVEIDSTFHAAPAADVALRWAEMTPASFRFTCKLPRDITHVCKLSDCSKEFGQFLRAIEPLAGKLQVILVQLPPSFTPRDGRTALRNFLKQLPRDFRFAIEFRHAGWHRPNIIRLLESYRVAWVWSDTTPLNERNLAPFEFLALTTDFIYVRLLGDYATKYDEQGKHRHRYDHLLWKREAALESWALKIERHLSEVRNAWIFVGNHYEGFAPETAQRLAGRLGFELPLPSGAEGAASKKEKLQLDLFIDAEDR